MNRAVIGIGSNIEPERNVAAAVDRIAADHELLARSRFVMTKPVGPPGQAEFLNGAILIRTGLSRSELRAYLRRVEKDSGRVRTSDRYAPRPIDLDILVFNGRITDRDVRTREFLRSAVRELCPDLALD